ncbi:hypothetical protein Ccr5_gp243 [Caulobacter phage Ccr5]|nr:hypothetical protein Ccr5_gp243 [Caulobacter phage Ccr5]
MADFSRARRSMETADLIERLKALHDLEDARDIPDEETKAALKEAVVQLGMLTEQVELSETLQKSYLNLVNFYKTDALASSQEPDFKRAAKELHLIETYPPRLRLAVAGFRKAMDEQGFLTGEAGRAISRLISKHLDHDLAGLLGSEINYYTRKAIAALRGLAPEEPKA